MKKLIYLGLIAGINFAGIGIASALPNHTALETHICSTGAISVFDENYYTAEVTFPAGYRIGDYIEFLRVAPISAAASGNYEISISYTRGNIAAAATFLGSISHSSPNLWREVGKVNSNGYVGGSDNHNFTIDCNTEFYNPRFRIRAVNTLGVLTDPLVVKIKLRSINFNAYWEPLNIIGNDLTVSKYLPMTNDWSLYVGSTFSNDGAMIAIKAITNGNVGIGTATPDSKLAVNGKIRAHEIKVETANWPDYVFAKDYQLITLQETENYIRQKGHLPGIPSAMEVKDHGIDLGEMNAKLLEKIEELTLHLIQQARTNEMQNKKLELQQHEIDQLKSKLDKPEALNTKTNL